MNAKLHDPIADLAQEIAAEEATDAENKQRTDDDKEAAPDKKAAGDDKDAAPDKDKSSEDDNSKEDKDKSSEDDGDKDDKEEDGDKDAAPDKDKSSEDDKDADKTKQSKSRSERMIPVSERNREAAARRLAERRLEEAQAELAKVKTEETKDGEAKPGKTEDQIRAEARAQARLELQVEGFLLAAYEEFGKKQFDDLSNILSNLGAPADLVTVALEACDSPLAAARAIFNLSQEDPDQIEEIFGMKPLKQAAALSKLSTTRRKTAKDEDADDDKGADDDKDTKLIGKKAGKVSRSEPPIRPINGRMTVEKGFGDDIPDEVFTKNFDELMSKNVHH